MKLEKMKLLIGSMERAFFLRPNSSDTGVIGQIFVDLAYDIKKLQRYSDLMDFLRLGRATGRRPLIVDAGANIGASSIYFSAECMDSRVIAIEPEAVNFQLLFENSKGLDILSLPCAVAATNKRMHVVETDWGNWGYRTQPAQNETRATDVNCVTLNEIYQTCDKDYFPFIVKIDIEGAEK